MIRRTRDSGTPFAAACLLMRPLRLPFASSKSPAFALVIKGTHAMMPAQTVIRKFIGSSHSDNKQDASCGCELGPECGTPCPVWRDTSGETHCRACRSTLVSGAKFFETNSQRVRYFRFPCDGLRAKRV